MKLSLNLQDCELPDGCDSIGELVQFMEQQYIPRDELVTRIVIDGEDVSPEMELELATRPLAEFESVEFFSARTLDLAHQSLLDARQFLPELLSSLQETVRELRAGRLRNGLVRFERSLEMISQYVSVINAIEGINRSTDPGRTMQPTADAPTDDNRTDFDISKLAPNPDNELRTFASIENLRLTLMSVQQAQRRADSMLLADLIEFDIQPIVGIWIRELPALNGQMQGHNARA